MENNEKIFTMEEMEKQQTKMQEFMEKNLPFLRIQHEHDTKLAEIEEARVRMFLARTQLAQLQAPPSDQDKKSEPGKEV